MKKTEATKKESKNIPLRIKAEMALKEAVAEAIAEHKRRGHPIAIWRDGKVVLLHPDEINITKSTQRGKIN